MKKVLVIEPDPGLSFLLCESLRDAGYEPVACAPEAAVALAAELPASAIVASLSSLSAEPPPLYTALRADPSTKDVALVLITGRGDVTIRRRLGERPPYVLFKPFEPAALAQTVTQAIAAA